jgi:microcystin-dependent protein
MFGGKDAPRGWALCNGQMLSVSEHPVLFSVIGSAFGGDGVETFALPNLQGRFPMHWGAGAGLSPRTLGESGGNEFVTITQAQMPSHSHPVAASNLDGNIAVPEGAVWAQTLDSSSTPVSAYATVANTTMSPSAIGATGGDQPLGLTNPFQCVTFIIALEGLPPSPN